MNNFFISSVKVMSLLSLNSARLVASNGVLRIEKNAFKDKVKLKKNKEIVIINKFFTIDY